MKNKQATGMEAVIAKSQKRAPLFKRKLADKLEAGMSAKSAPKDGYGEKSPSEKEKPADSMKETDPKALNAKIDALMARIDALEAKLNEDED